MKLCIFSGNHPRHLYLIEELFNLFDECMVFGVFRENIFPDSSHIKNYDLRNLFEKHFDLRHQKEEAAFGTKSIFNFCNQNMIHVYEIERNSLNAKKTKKAFTDFRPDLCVVMGAYILDDEFLNLLPKKSFNIHLGLSPWYRGSATLFWPSYNLEPWKAGVTLHKLSSIPDGGNIFHQSAVSLKRGFSAHDVAINAIKNSKNGIIELSKSMKNNLSIKSKKQQLVGRSYLSSQFRPEHLKLIYETFEDKIVDYIFSLYETLPKPKLVSFLNE